MTGQDADDRFAAQLVARARKKFNVPAIALTAMNSSGIKSVHIEGRRVFDEETPATINDLFHIGSCAKAVLATIAGRLVDEEKLHWETKFFDVFPELAGQARPEYLEITLEDLFLCEAGIKPYTGPDEKFPDLPRRAADRIGDFVKYLIQLPPAAARRQSGRFVHLYSNASYTMASAMLEKTLGLSYPDMIRDMFGQLNWQGHVGWPADRGGDQPWGHMVSGKNIMKFSPDHEYRLPDLLAPSGDLSMKPLEFSAFILMHLQGLTGQDTWISNQTCRTIHFAYPGFSLGVGNGKVGGKKLSVINGSAGTFFTQATIFPEQDFAFTIMTNAGNGTAYFPAIEWMSARVMKYKFGRWHNFRLW